MNSASTAGPANSKASGIAVVISMIGDLYNEFGDH